MLTELGGASPCMQFVCGFHICCFFSSHSNTTTEFYRKSIISLQHCFTLGILNIIFSSKPWRAKTVPRWMSKSQINITALGVSICILLKLTRDHTRKVGMMIWSTDENPLLQIYLYKFHKCRISGNGLMEHIKQCLQTPISVFKIEGFTCAM